MTIVTDAVRTVEAMAEIPCLRGGFACFDDGLEPRGWDRTQDNLGTIWALVPDRPEDAERSMRASIDECRDDLLHMLDWASSREASASGDQGARDRYNAMLGALMAGGSPV